MSKKHFGFYLVIISFLIVGCASIPEPNNNKQTLIIGEINFEGKNYPENFRSLNGNHKMGVEITMENISTNRTYTITSERGGTFYSVKIPEGRYRITSFYYKSPTGQWQRYSYPSAIEEFNIMYGMVNNFGKLDWIHERIETVYNGRTLHDQEYDRVKNDFFGNNPKSIWNEKQWFSVFNKL